ncbi:phosphoethanolamine transferase [Verminephrobacter eiseniae]|nr:phosphoethanolamine--lipid A transferase [Verminephrobacter eiseniae]MCW5303848.1 phosphoethanolamine--lipid A transferase [Verminephrobacter eiseniae]MCW8181007.1 phosphoethanolamine--lipid A transferase [Verminephrobacter eiseniae]MCW8190907.1 phosphoethanolamine--lipid A transferase [Verminephrobacter eiseniae]
MLSTLRRLLPMALRSAFARRPGDPASPSGRRPIHPAQVVLLTSAWLASACNLPLWQAVARLPGQGSLRGWGFALAFWLIVMAGNTALLSLLAWRWTLKPAVVLLLLMAAFGAYFMLAYGIVIDAGMLVNVQQTDPREARDLLSGRMAVTVSALALPPLLWLRRRPLQRLGALRQLRSNSLLLGGSITVGLLSLLLVFQDFASAMRNHSQMRYLINPLNSVYALGHLAAQPLRMDTSVLLPLGRDARLGASYAGQTQAPLLILVLGETGRSQNFGINGYERDTTALLAARKDLISARNAWSCGTSTAASLPCMFSHLGRAGYAGRSANHENLLDVLQHAGLALLWVDNQAGCKGVCARIAQTRPATDPALCPDGECLDRAMLDGLSAQIAALPAARRQRGTVVVLHQIGSHGPAYYKRSAPQNKKFMPECHSAALQECARQQVVNAYDNSIVETDQFLAALLQWLAAPGHAQDHAQAAMIYVSDHGESLGENNLYLHGLPYAIAPDVQKHVPWITWLSPAMQARTGLATGCLQRDLGQRQISHDNYFHSVLGLMDVQTSAYDPALDMFARCKARGEKE